MKTKIVALLLSVMALAATGAVASQKDPMVGGQQMYPTKDIIDNAVNSPTILRWWQQ